MAICSQNNIWSVSKATNTEDVPEMEQSAHRSFRALTHHLGPYWTAWRNTNLCDWWTWLLKVSEYESFPLKALSIKRNVPSYLCNCLQFYTPSRTLRSTSDTLGIQIPRTRLSAVPAPSPTSATLYGLCYPSSPTETFSGLLHIKPQAISKQ